MLTEIHALRRLRGAGWGWGEEDRTNSPRDDDDVVWGGENRRGKKYKDRAVILFVVSVPVLSVQIVVAQPIVSQADSCFTKFWHCIILLDENANERVTASGKPCAERASNNI